jgi:hypothetical protein
MLFECSILLVAKSGLQTGAQAYARDHGIVLYELRHKKEEDWAPRKTEAGYEVRIKAVHTNARALIWAAPERSFSSTNSDCLSDSGTGPRSSAVPE